MPPHTNDGGGGVEAYTAASRYQDASIISQHSTPTLRTEALNEGGGPAGARGTGAPPGGGGGDGFSAGGVDGGGGGE